MGNPVHAYKIRYSFWVTKKNWYIYEKKEIIKNISWFGTFIYMNLFIVYIIHNHLNKDTH